MRSDLYLHIWGHGAVPGETERVRELVWCLKAYVTAELRGLSMREEGDMQVCVLQRCMSTPTGPCESEAGHVLG